MRGLVQRVTRASVAVVDHDAAREPEVVGRIGRGLCLLVGATHDDTSEQAAALASKAWNLRVFDDDAGVMNRSLADLVADGAGPTDASPVGILVVSQFTLYGDTTRGRRPSWIAAARPEHAEPLVDHVVDTLRALGAHVATGRFRTEMRVELVNDGPVTLLLET